MGQRNRAAVRGVCDVWNRGGDEKMRTTAESQAEAFRRVSECEKERKQLPAMTGKLFNAILFPAFLGCVSRESEQERIKECK